MTQSSQKSVSLRDAPPRVGRLPVPCPECEYDLRGLPGKVIACPECGARWRRAVLQQPVTWPFRGAEVLVQPLGWAFGCLFGGSLLAIAVSSVVDVLRLLTVVLVVSVAAWGVALGHVWWKFASVKWVLYSLAMQTVVLVYVLGVLIAPLLFLVGLGRLIAWKPDGLVWLFMAGLCVALVCLSYRVDKVIGRKCHRWYLQQRARVEAVEKTAGMADRHGSNSA